MGWLIANFIAAEAILAFWFLGTWWSMGATQTEVAEGVLIASIIFVPPGFLLIYPLYRLATRSFYRHHAPFRVLTGAWLPGTIVAAVLVLVGKFIGLAQRILPR